MRPAGGFTPDMLNYAYSANTYQIYADMIAFDESTKPLGQRHYCAYMGRRDDKHYQMDHIGIRGKYGSCMKMYGRVPVALSGAMGDSLYMAVFDTREQMQEFYRDLMA